MQLASRRALAAVALVALAACSEPDEERPTSIAYAVGGPLAGAPAGAAYDVALVAAERTLLITTIGSGSCPTVPTRMDVRSRSEVRLTLDGRYSEICTADLTATTSFVRLDSDALDLRALLTVVVEEAGGPGGRIIARTLPSLPRPTRTLPR